jgi:hypothetical protein
MDFSAYLAFLKRHNHNCLRLWAWESYLNRGAKQGTIRYDLMPSPFKLALHGFSVVYVWPECER